MLFYHFLRYFCLHVYHNVILLSHEGGAFNEEKYFRFGYKGRKKKEKTD